MPSTVQRPSSSAAVRGKSSKSEKKKEEKKFPEKLQPEIWQHFVAGTSHDSLRWPDFDTAHLQSIENLNDPSTDEDDDDDDVENVDTADEEEDEDSGNINDSRSMAQACRNHVPQAMYRVTSFVPVPMETNHHRYTKGRKPNANNNFIKPGQFMRSHRTWAEDRVFNRIDILAQPKQLPEGYTGNIITEEERRRPPPTGPEGHTIFAVTPRLDALSKPIKLCGVFIGRRHCDWEKDYPPVIRQARQFGARDFDRLAAPNQPRCPPCLYNYAVNPAALKYEITPRVEKLAVPRKKIDMDQYYENLLHRKPDVETKLKKIQRLSIDKCDMENARVMIRCDLDPQDAESTLESKIELVLPSIKHALDKGAKSVVIATHCGEPRGQKLPNFSLRPVAKKLEEALETKVLFIDDCVGYEALHLCEDPEPGSVFLLENLRFHAAEDGCGIDEKGQEFVCLPDAVQTYRKKLFSMCDVYVMDTLRGLVDMSNSSIGLPSKERAMGLNVKSELDAYNRFVVKPARPMVAVIGGDFRTYIKVVYNFIGKAEEILLGGKLALAFIKTVKALDIGNMEVTPGMEKTVMKVMARAKDNDCIIYLPADHVIVDINYPERTLQRSAKEFIEKHFEIIDIGSETQKCYRNIISTAASVVWVGIMGSGSLEGMKVIAEKIAECTEEGTLKSYIADNVAIDAFTHLCPGMQVTNMSRETTLTEKFLRRKIPKGISKMSAPRKTIQKRPPPEEEIPQKRTQYVVPGQRTENARRRLSVDQLDLKDKRVLLRVNLNVPRHHGKPDNYNLRMFVPTIRFILKAGAKRVVIIADKVSVENNTPSLKSMAEQLTELLGQKVSFYGYNFADVEYYLNYLPTGSVALLENLLLNRAEVIDPKSHVLQPVVLSNLNTPMISGKDTPKETKPPEPTSGQAVVSETTVLKYIESLSKLGDCFVNEAFTSLHQPFRSMTSLLHKERACGFLVKNEIKYLAKIANDVPRRFLAIIGGGQTEKKIHVLQSLLNEVDNIILTGTIGLHCQHVDQGMLLARSLDASINLESIAHILELAKRNNVRVHFPVDLVIAEDGKGTERTVSASSGVPQGMMCLDIGERSRSMFSRIIKHAKLILWYGTVGDTRFHEEGTEAIYKSIVEHTSDPDTKAVSIVVGRSVAAYIHSHDPLHEGISHITTGGESAMKLITEKTLLGLESLSYAPKDLKLPQNLTGSDQAILQDARILFLFDFNMPRNEEGGPRDPNMLKPLVAIIKGFFRKGAKAIILIGHLGTPRGRIDKKYSLEGFKAPLEKLLKEEVKFFDAGVVESTVTACRIAGSGSTSLVENLGFHPGEYGWEYSPAGKPFRMPYSDLEAYRKHLSDLGDIYIIDTLDDLCEATSAVVGVTKASITLGPTAKVDFAKLAPIMSEFKFPILLIIGEAEVDDLCPLLYDFLDCVETIILIGTPAFTYMQEVLNQDIGYNETSYVFAAFLPRLMSKINFNGIHIHVPVDLVCQTGENEEGEEIIETLEVAEMPQNALAYDIGPSTVAAYTELINNAKTVLIMGSAGQYTNEKYQEGTKGLLDALSEATTSGIATIGLGPAIKKCLEILEYSDALTHCTTSIRFCFDVIKGKDIPGFYSITKKQDKPQRKQCVDNIDLTNKRVMIRIDLNIPMVDGVVLDNDKLDDVLPTIKHCLSSGAKSVTIIGCRGNPDGKIDPELSTEPLIGELSILLDTEVTFLQEPVSPTTKILLEDPQPGTVFLMENLLFYLAESGKEEEEQKEPEEGAEEGEEGEGGGEEGEEGEKEEGKEEEAEPKEKPSKAETAPGEDDEAAANEEGAAASTAEEAKKMPILTVRQYAMEMKACADVFINDDVTNIGEPYTSNNGFNIKERACGFLLQKFLQEDSSAKIMALPGVSSLNTAK